MSEFKINSMEKHRDLWVAYVEAGGYSLGFSQHEDEDQWFADSMFRMSDCYPCYSHGEGSRSCRKSVAAGSLHDALEARRLSESISADVVRESMRRPGGAASKERAARGLI